MSPVVIGIASFKGGVGKSVICSTLPVVFKKEFNKNSILFSLDKKRDAKSYSNDSLLIINIEEKEKVINKKEEDKIFVYKIKEEKLVKQVLNTEKFDFLFLDFGGRWDSRIHESNCDYYLIPIFGKPESPMFKEGIRTAEFIKMNKKDAQIIFLFNPFSVKDRKQKNDQKSILIETLKVYGFENSSVIELPSNYLFEKMTFEKVDFDSIIKAPLDFFNYRTKIKPVIEEIYEIIK
jgi:cellulose biosynthesis protein BcsQ